MCRFQECNFEINAAFQGDWPKRFDQDITPMLDDGIRTLIYAGQHAAHCSLKSFCCQLQGRVRHAPFSILWAR